MRLIFKIYLLVFSLATLFSCVPIYQEHYNNAKYYYDEQNYENAVNLCLHSLKENNEYEDAHLLLEQSYNKSIEVSLDKIKQIKYSKQSQFFWDDVYEEYYYCINLSDKIAKSGLPIKESLRKSISKYEKNLYSGFEDAKYNAAEQHYLEGNYLAKSKTTDDQKSASKHFSLALKYYPNYKDAQKRYEECKTQAIKRIAIIPFEDRSGKQGRYGDISGMVVDNISSMLLNDAQASEFIELVARTELENVYRELGTGQNQMFDQTTAVKVGQLLHIHEVIQGKITQIIFNPERTSEIKQDEKRTVIVDYKVTGKDEKGREIKEAVWGDIHATAYLKKKTSSAQILGSFQIIDVETGKIKKTGNCTGKEDFVYEWASYRGNPEALSSQVKKLTEKGEVFSNEDEMVLRSVGYLSKNLYDIIRDYTK